MSDPVPILFTIPNFITAGSGQAMLNIIERLDRQQFAPAICVLKKGGDLDSVVEQMGIPFLTAPFAISAKPYASLLIRARKAATYFRPYRFQLWQSFHYLDDYTEPMIAFLAGTRNWVYSKKNMSWGSRAWWLRTSLARGIVAQNTNMLTEFFPRQARKTSLIPRGVDTVKFSPGEARNELRSTWGFPEDTRIAVHVGQLVPVKNQAFLLKALAKTQEKIGLLFVGDPLNTPYAKKLQTLADDLGIAERVQFLGRRADIPEILRSVDLFAFCSLRESCPVAVLEAMASGLPSVVNDIAAMTDLHVPDVTAEVVQADDVSAFAAALDRLSVDDGSRRRLGRAARQRATGYYRIEREAADYQSFYRELLNL
jgi:glycosyltransferase involved in cell wall biosynthesis